MKAVDATTLSLLVDPNADIPNDPSTGRRPERAKERVEFLIETLETEGTKLLIPTPALSEVLILAGNDGPVFLQEWSSSSVFKIADFDQLAAVEAAALIIALEKKYATKAVSGTKVKTKYDVQIVAIAKVNRADAIYSEDSGVLKIAAEVGIRAISVVDLPMPPATQPELFTSETMDAPDSHKEE